MKGVGVFFLAGIFEGVWSNNSCGLAVAVFPQSTQSFLSMIDSPSFIPISTQLSGIIAPQGKRADYYYWYFEEKALLFPEFVFQFW